MNRNNFIDLAGGVYENTKYYTQWSGTQKSENFWSFFDDTTDDYIHSVYAGVPVDLLKRKRMYSIEHIIPKSFLKTYLGKIGAEETVIKGSTTNPLNFAAAHRNINSARWNWPFDVEDDRIVRSYQIDMKGIYSDFGLDNEKEWVIPIRTQGDLARSILYMCLVYGISELYGEHLNVYRNWAKLDPPNIWELKYNDWVAEKLGIRNPLVADYNNPAQAFELLNDDQLMSSILLHR
ncbi:hypothetical protein C9980_25250 [Vibrio mediterranei]|uniref:Endonuclease I n=2 Tax=Vibrio TaxID=662 RepID=A0AAN1FKW7_9VIBR|nr:endonuclease [Vibrio mediterranei]ASI92477.1 hypothetical protein BSZ05_22010 [Vibrio mediterranei]PTC02007.1 hypothetical protein C9980_25250 [Vibrio mediterranei]